MPFRLNGQQVARINRLAVQQDRAGSANAAVADFLAPVRSRWSRKASSSVTRGSTVSLCAWPLILRVMATGPGPTVVSWPGEGVAAAVSVASNPVDTAAPAPFRKSRRVKPTLGAASFGFCFFGFILCSFLSLDKVQQYESSFFVLQKETMPCSLTV